MNKNKILITGSCGFIGANLTRKLSYEKYKIASLDRGDINDVSSIYSNKNHKFYLADLKDKHILDQIFQLEKPEIVIHLALDKDDDCLATSNLIEASSKFGISKIIYSSDSGVYGVNESISSIRLDEKSKLNPTTKFIENKINCENLIKNSKLDYTIARLSTNYGSRQKSYNLIPGIIKAVLKNEEVQIPSALSSQEYTHVHDTCSAFVSMMENISKNEIYNVSSNQEFGDMELAHEVCSILEKYHGTKCQHLVKYGSEKSQFEVNMNSDKLKSIGWQPLVKFKQGVEQTVDWFMSNQWCLK